MLKPGLVLTDFAGINNRVPEARQKDSDLAEAVDVDVGLARELRRRAGTTKIADGCHKNLRQATGRLLATSDADLTAILPDGSREVLHAGTGTTRMAYSLWPDGSTAYSNGLHSGVVLSDGTRLDWALPTPDHGGLATSTPGALPAAQYHYRVAFKRLADEREGPAWLSPALALDGGLVLTGLPEREGYATVVYLGSPDGEMAYWVGEAVGGALTFTAHPSALQLPARPAGWSAAPQGTVLGFWRGSALVAQGPVLYASLNGDAFTFDLARDYKVMPSDITGIVELDDGIYLGTELALFFLAGDTFDTLRQLSCLPGRVVRGSMVAVPGEYIGLGDATGHGSAMMCMVGNDVAAGFAGGQTSLLTQGRYDTGAPAEVTACWRINADGVPQYLAAEQ